MQGSSVEKMIFQPVPILLLSVIAVSVMGFAMKSFYMALILRPSLVWGKRQVYRLLTAGWLHVDGSHLAVNMISLFFFAGDTLRVLGVGRFFLLYLSAVVVGYLPTTVRHRNEQQYTSLGASGAVAAVMFSAVLLYPKMKLYLMMLPIPVPGIVYAIGYIAYSAWHSYRATDNINHDAHLTGAAYGALLTYVMEPARVEKTLRAFF